MSTMVGMKQAKAGRREAMAEQITARRIAKGWSVPQLAKRLGKVRSTVNKWEEGKSCPGGETIQQLAREFECTIGELYGERQS